MEKKETDAGWVTTGVLVQKKVVVCMLSRRGAGRGVGALHTGAQQTDCTHLAHRQAHGSPEQTGGDLHDARLRGRGIAGRSYGLLVQQGAGALQLWAGGDAAIYSDCTM